MAKKAASKAAKAPKAPATAAGQLLGYGLQYTRLTAMLLNAQKGSVCSVEVIDDVAETTAEGKTTLGQTKSALTANPVSNHASSLWKTLYNWVRLVKLGHVDVTKTTFEIYVSRIVPTADTIVGSFNDAHSEDAAKQALTKAKDTLWGKAPDFALKSELSDSIAKYVNSLFEEDNESVLVNVVQNMRLVCSDATPQTEIVEKLEKMMFPPAHILDVADKLCGWVKRQADTLLEQALPAYILVDDFRVEGRAFRQRIDRALILHARAVRPTASEQKAQHTRLQQDSFVRQMDLIELEYDEQLQAVSDYMLAAAHRVLWAAEGDVHLDSFDDLDAQLIRKWHNLKETVRLENNNLMALDNGKLVFRKCMDHKTTVQGMEAPDWFIPGCYHELADAMTVGWHPDYKKLLSK